MHCTDDNEQTTTALHIDRGAERTGCVFTFQPDGYIFSLICLLVFIVRHDIFCVTSHTKWQGLRFPAISLKLCANLTFDFCANATRIQTKMVCIWTLSRQHKSFSVSCTWRPITKCYGRYPKISPRVDHTTTSTLTVNEVMDGPPGPWITNLTI